MNIRIKLNIYAYNDQKQESENIFSRADCFGLVVDFSDYNLAETLSALNNHLNLIRENRPQAFIFLLGIGANTGMENNQGEIRKWMGENQIKYYHEVPSYNTAEDIKSALKAMVLKILLNEPEFFRGLKSSDDYFLVHIVFMGDMGIRIVSQLKGREAEEIDDVLGMGAEIGMDIELEVKELPQFLIDKINTMHEEAKREENIKEEEISTEKMPPPPPGGVIPSEIPKGRPPKCPPTPKPSEMPVLKPPAEPEPSEILPPEPRAARIYTRGQDRARKEDEEKARREDEERVKPAKTLAEKEIAEDQKAREKKEKPSPRRELSKKKAKKVIGEVAEIREEYKEEYKEEKELAEDRLLEETPLTADKIRLDKEETIQETRVLKRKTTVFYYKQMNPFTLNKLSVVLSTEEIYEKLKKKKVAAERVGSEKALEIKEVSPYIQVQPVFPGCICVPSILPLDARKEKDVADFQITPLATGDILEARVEIYYENKLVDVIHTPTRVVKQTAAKIGSAFAVLLPIFGPLFDEQLKPITSRIPFYDKIGGLEGLVMIISAIFALISSIFYLIKRPREAEPVEKVPNFPELNEIR